MRKKSYIHAFSQNMLTMPIDVRYCCFKKAMTLINQVFTAIFHVPNGYRRCPDCNAARAVHPYNETTIKENFTSNSNGDIFLFSYCATCKGTGFIPFRQLNNDFRRSGYYSECLAIPIYVSEYTNFEITSIIFYMLYNPIALNLDQYIVQSKYSPAAGLREFLAYYKDYKSARDQRRQFIRKNLHDLRKNLKRSFKNYTVNQNRYGCDRCHCDPFDIFNEWSLDTIMLKICGNCCGIGYRQGGTVSTIKEEYRFPLENADYTDKEAMLDSLLNNAYMYRRFLILEKGRMVLEKNVQIEKNGEIG